MTHTPLFDLLEVRGPDALAFLQAQLAADLNPLADAGWRWSALLNAQGRVLHVLGVWRVAADHWRLLVPFARGEELCAALCRMVFRRKVQLQLDGNATLGACADGVDAGVGGLRVGIVACADASAIGGIELDRFFADGLALIDAAASGRHLVQSLRLDRFDAFSVKKGCYPGQEIVARTHFLGRNKRHLVQLDAASAVAWKSADAVAEVAIQVGEIACAGQCHALAVLTESVAVGTRLRVGDGDTWATVAATPVFTL